jgi:predicted  nucleic acid-binding Zn-ribbon protein
MEAMPPVKKMSEEGTVTPEVKLRDVENRLDDETDRLRKLYAAYESQEKELIDIKAEIEVLEKEIVEREIEKEGLEGLLSQKDNRIRDLELRDAKVSKQIEHLEPELHKMEEKYSREKDRLGKVFSIAEELDNDLRLAVVELSTRDEWYVEHMSLFEELTKAIQNRYEMIEDAIETERQSQHMQRAITDRMDEVIESRAAEMTLEEAETRIESDKETLEPTPEEEPAEETTKKPTAPKKNKTKKDPVAVTAVDDDEEWNWSDSVLDGVIEKYGISDRDTFIEFAKAYDKDGNHYLKGSELGAAAVDWVKEHPVESNSSDSEWADETDPWAEK